VLALAAAAAAASVGEASAPPPSGPDAGGRRCARAARPTGGGGQLRRRKARNWPQTSSRPTHDSSLLTLALGRRLLLLLEDEAVGQVAASLVEASRVVHNHMLLAQAGGARAAGPELARPLALQLARRARASAPGAQRARSARPAPPLAPSCGERAARGGLVQPEA